MSSNRIDRWAVREMLMRLDTVSRTLQHIEHSYPHSKALTELGDRELGKVRDTILAASTTDISLGPMDAA